MIFVTLGNATQGFRRCLDAVDLLAGSGFFGDEEVFLQSGNNPSFVASYCAQKSFLTVGEFVEKIQEASLVICHAGAGTLYHVFQAGKVPVVMPRRVEFQEHIDDHQIELTQMLASEGRIVPAYEPADLPRAIAEARRAQSVPTVRPASRIVGLVAQALDEIAKRS
jgi:UDP-N-acetylglucosamine transferase subunit ALG13